MKKLDEILLKVERGELSASEARNELSDISFADITHTKIDLDRRVRTGYGEVIYGEGKTVEQILEIAETLLKNENDVLATRLSTKAMQSIKSAYPEAEINTLARTASVRVSHGKPRSLRGGIALLSAGTSDMPVAEESRVCAEFFGSKVECFYDCGVAGLHRLVSKIDEIRKARVVIAVAGMEGALASVVAGLVRVPVIAVPTSEGYGANFRGLSALLAMLNSCANGVSVVNIDNGFGAAYSAHLINMSAHG